MPDGEQAATDPHVSAEDDRYEARQAQRLRRIGDYSIAPCVEELAAAWRLRNRGVTPAPEPETTDDIAIDYSIEPW